MIEMWSFYESFLMGCPMVWTDALSQLTETSMRNPPNAMSIYEAFPGTSMNFNHLTVLPSLESWLDWGKSSPFMAELFRLVNYDNWPRSQAFEFARVRLFRHLEVEILEKNNWKRYGLEWNWLTLWFFKHRTRKSSVLNRNSSSNPDDCQGLC